MTNFIKTKIVEIQCKTPCKTKCNNYVKLCAKLLLTTTSCVYPPLFHFLLTSISHTFTHHFTPIPNQSFPLFHQAYYYNY